MATTGDVLEELFGKGDPFGRLKRLKEERDAGVAIGFKLAIRAAAKAARDEGQEGLARRIERMTFARK